VRQSQGQFSLSKTLSTSFVGEDSKTKIFEHLESLLSPGERKSSRRGATIAIGFVARKKLGPLDQRSGEQRRAQRRRTDHSRRI
jgi:hypothetical protein